MAIVKVTDRPDLLKDTTSGALLVVDKRKADEYFEKKKQIKEMKTIKEEINNIKENMQDIKELLNRIANK